MDLYESVRAPVSELEEPEPAFTVGDILESKKRYSLVKVLHVYTGPSINEPAYLVLNLCGINGVHGFKESVLIDHFEFKKKETWTF